MTEARVYTRVEVRKTYTIREWDQDGEFVYDWEDDQGETSPEWFSTPAEALSDVENR